MLNLVLVFYVTVLALPELLFSYIVFDFVSNVTYYKLYKNQIQINRENTLTTFIFIFTFSAINMSITSLKIRDMLAIITIKYIGYKRTEGKLISILHYVAIE